MNKSDRNPRQLNINLQPARSPELDVDAAVARLSGLDPGARVTEGQDRGRWIHIDFWPHDLPKLWAAVRDELRAIPGLAQAAIIVCEGKWGWDDYLLLHHFDPAESLDQLGDVAPARG